MPDNPLRVLNCTQEMSNYIFIRLNYKITRAFKIKNSIQRYGVLLREEPKPATKLRRPLAPCPLSIIRWLWQRNLEDAARNLQGHRRLSP
jgi:hypothetical protein